MAYAEKTEVPFDKSISQIVTLVRTAGAESLGQMENPGEFMLGFQLAGRMIRFKLPLPALEDMPFRNGRNMALSPKQRSDQLAQTKRSRGRARHGLG